MWCVAPDELDGPPLDRLGPDALEISVDELGTAFATHNMRLHTFLRDQHLIAGLGRMLANEVCHRARLSPFTMTAKLGADGPALVRGAIHSCIAEALEHERARTDMSSSADRPGAVHHRVGQPCTTCAENGPTARVRSRSGKPGATRSLAKRRACPASAARSSSR